MIIKICKIYDNTFNEKEVEIIINCSKPNDEIDELIEYINCYHKYVLVKCNNTIEKIKYDDIIIFYSDKKNNYCKTISKVYKLKSKLYEIETISNSFVRISKNCIVNINHINKFDLN